MENANSEITLSPSTWNPSPLPGENRGTAPEFRTVLGVIRDPCGSLVASRVCVGGFARQLLREDVLSQNGGGSVMGSWSQLITGAGRRVKLVSYSVTGPRAAGPRPGFAVVGVGCTVVGLGRRRRGVEVRCPAVSRGRGFVGRAGPRIVYTTASVGAPGFLGTTASVGARGRGIVVPGCVAIGQGIGGPAPGITWRVLR